MDPVSIAASVTKIASTCAVTGKAIYDLSCKYKDAPRTMVAISSEMTVVSASLSQIEGIISSRQHSQSLLRTRPAIAATLDTALTGCMVLFSCLDEEVKNVSKYSRGHDTFSWKGKTRVVWKHETFQELLEGIRGQQSAISVLIQLLQMDSVLEIKQLLQQNGPDLRETVERTQSLRRSHPQVKVAESIYNRDDRVSVYSARDSILASSDLDFDFDGVVVNSAAYRRVLAVAKQQIDVSKHDEPSNDLIDLSDDTTVRQFATDHSSQEAREPFEDMPDLHFSTNEPPLPQSLVTDFNGHSINDPRDEHDHDPDIVHTGDEEQQAAPNLQSSNLQDDEAAGHSPGHETIVVIPKILPRRPSWKPADDPNHTVEHSQKKASLSNPHHNRSRQKAPRMCAKCKLTLTGQFVRALEDTYHAECFTCKDCGRNVASRFFPAEDDGTSSDFRPYPLCESDYFARLGLICFKCQKALRGSYITAADQKYHLEHLTCSKCPFVIGAEGIFYEHFGKPVCEGCFVKEYADVCPGCGLPIFSTCVGKTRKGVHQMWHVDCDLMYRHWKLETKGTLAVQRSGDDRTESGNRELDNIAFVRHVQSSVAMLSHIWTTLSNFETKVANTISNMSTHMSKGMYNEGTLSAALMLSSFGILLTALDVVEDREAVVPQTLFVNSEAELAAGRFVVLFQEFAESAFDRSEPREINQELLSIASSLIRCLNALVKYGITASIHTPQRFLDDMAMEYVATDLDYYKPRMRSLLDRRADTCLRCNTSVDEHCFQNQQSWPQIWHVKCLRCPDCDQDAAYVNERQELSALSKCSSCGTKRHQNIYHVTRLKRYRHLLWVALARLMAATKTDFNALDDVNFDLEATRDGQEEAT